MGGTLYSYRSIVPATWIGQGLDSRRKVQSEESWRILTVRPLPGNAGWFRSERWLLMSGILVAIGAISWGWGSAQADHRAAQLAEKRASEVLVRSEKMAALGGLVAGVAHELNTPIGNAKMIASTLNERIRQFEHDIAGGKIRRSALMEFADEIHSGSNIMLRGLTRAAELISRFKQVAVDQSSEQRRSFKLDEYVREVVDTIQPTIKHRPTTLSVDTDCDATLDSYPGPLGQVLLNLVTNALVHAFPEGREGTIAVRTRSISKQEVEISVVDDGVGIPKEVVTRIFEPFFTTRLGTGGSGLGLSIAYSLVTDQLGGSIHVESSPNEFTVFRVRLPVNAPKIMREHGRRGATS